MTLNISVSKIQKWWKKTNSILELKKVHQYLNSSLTKEDLQELSNKCHSITNVCKGDGAGLLGGCLVDMLLSQFFKEKLKEYEEFHNGENDMKICQIPLSQKKINGKSTIALDWSKNQTDSKREHFSSHIIIINLFTEQWWKSKPNKILVENSKIIYNEIIPAGIYFIDKQYCKKYIALSQNNKTNTLIDSQYLYLMLRRSRLQKLFIEIPEPNKKLDFHILKAFV